MLELAISSGRRPSEREPLERAPSVPALLERPRTLFERPLLDAELLARAPLDRVLPVRAPFERAPLVRSLPERALLVRSLPERAPLVRSPPEREPLVRAPLDRVLLERALFVRLLLDRALLARAPSGRLRSLLPLLCPSLRASAASARAAARPPRVVRDGPRRRSLGRTSSGSRRTSLLKFVSFPCW